ncbi:alpha/beta fold hydrolase [Myxosarcina sp. GI1(2024)]
MTSTSSSVATSDAGIGGKVERYTWNWQGKAYQVVYETIGQGNSILLLPAFSTVSSRSEMKAIARILSSQYRVTALDWLGFGESDRPAVYYKPDLFSKLLQDFVAAVFQEEITTIASGHAAGYALQLAKKQPEAVAKLILIAPTWQGPLRVMGLPNAIRSGVKNLVRSPILGQILYYFNTTPSFLRLMYKRHVYVDETKLTPEFIAKKHQITQKPGARYAPAAFVTGKLDPVSSREELLDYFQSLSIPVAIVLAEDAPPYSKAEMEAMADLEGVQAVRLPGTLGIYEEYSQSIMVSIQDWL